MFLSVMLDAFEFSIMILSLERRRNDVSRSRLVMQSKVSERALRKEDGVGAIGVMNSERMNCILLFIVHFMSILSKPPDPCLQGRHDSLKLVNTPWIHIPNAELPDSNASPECDSNPSTERGKKIRPLL